MNADLLVIALTAVFPVLLLLAPLMMDRLESHLLAAPAAQDGEQR